MYKMKFDQENQNEIVHIMKELNSKKFNHDYTLSLQDCNEKNNLYNKLRLCLIRAKNLNIPKEVVKNKKFPHFLQNYFTA